MFIILISLFVHSVICDRLMIKRLKLNNDKELNLLSTKSLSPLTPTSYGQHYVLIVPSNNNAIYLTNPNNIIANIYLTLSNVTTNNGIANTQLIYQSDYIAPFSAIELTSTFGTKSPSGTETIIGRAYDTRIFISSDQPIGVIVNVGKDLFSVIPKSMAASNYAVSFPSIVHSGLMYFLPIDSDAIINLDIFDESYKTHILENVVAKVATGSYMPYLQIKTNTTLSASSNVPFLIFVYLGYKDVAFMPTPLESKECVKNNENKDVYYLSLASFFASDFLVSPAMITDCDSTGLATGSNEHTQTMNSLSSLKGYVENITESVFGSYVKFVFSNSGVKLYFYERSLSFMDNLMSWKQYTNGTSMFVVISKAIVTIIGDSQTKSDGRLINMNRTLNWQSMNFTPTTYAAEFNMTDGIYLFSSPGRYSIFIQGFINDYFNRFSFTYGYNVAFNGPKYPIKAANGLSTFIASLILILSIITNLFIM